VSDYINHVDRGETPEKCCWCGDDLPMTWVRDKSLAGLFFKKVPMRNGLDFHRRACAESCAEKTCRTKRTQASAFCSRHAPEARAEAQIRAKAEELRRSRSMKRKEFGNPLTTRSLLSLTVIEFATLTMVAKGLEQLDGNA
jgi:hypothetical protein